MLFELLIPRGEIFIVTNATAEWIEDCMKIGYPNLWKIYSGYLQKRLVSAREKFELNYPESPFKWKMEMFKVILRGRKDLRCVFSIGDSLYERDALFRVLK